MGGSKISVAQVRHVAELARLALSDEQLQTMCAQLDAILEYMAELDRIDVEGVEPSYHAVRMSAPLRPDVVEPSLLREQVLAAAPQPVEGGFAVPRVIAGTEVKE